jgi:hypothetical protein
MYLNSLFLFISVKRHGIKYLLYGLAVLGLIMSFSGNNFVLLYAKIKKKLVITGVIECYLNLTKYINNKINIKFQIC